MKPYLTSNLASELTGVDPAGVPASQVTGQITLIYHDTNFVEATVRIGLSVPQVGSVLFAMVSITAIDIFLFREAKMTGEVRWGRMPAISQYVLIFIAVTFTWLMGLMGYIRSGLRQHWHVYGVVRDTSVDAFTPTIGFATRVVSVTVLLFFCLVAFVFWITSLHDKPDFQRQTKAS